MIFFYVCADDVKANTNAKLVLAEKKKNKELKKEIREMKRENFALQKKIKTLTKRMKTIHSITNGII